ncbi:MAG: hypothetical protein M9962_00540 [Oligoflexia bacterium]|nr:hypothetical protein [Oligoflexia bacterium]
MKTITTLCLLALSLSASAFAGVESDIQKLENIVQNNIPQKYRPMLMGALDDLRLSTDRECRAIPQRPVRPGIPACGIKFDSGFYAITKNGDTFGAWTKDLDALLAQKRELQNNRICSAHISDEYCDIASDTGFYAIKVGENLMSIWSKDLKAQLSLIEKFRSAGLCQ